MLLLALEAAGPGVSVALGGLAGAGGPGIFGVRRDDQRGAGDRLLAHVADLLGEAGIKAQALAGVVVDRGPGSFTGVRTVVAAARALALASGRPLFAFTRFELLASAVRAPRPAALAVVLRVGPERVLLQAFDAEREPLGPPRLVSAEHALEGLARPLLVVGSGAEHALRTSTADGVCSEPAAEVDAAALLELATIRIAAGLAPVRPFELEPMYPRPPDAVPPRRLIERGDDDLMPAHASAQA